MRDTDTQQGLTAFQDNLTDAGALMRKFLMETSAWIDGDGPSSSYFGPGTDRMLKRRYFSGQPVH